MTREKKQIFTRRITHANRTQLIVVLYDMLLVYLEDAGKAYDVENMYELVSNLEAARRCILELRNSLNFEYELSKTLFSIYSFADRKLASCISSFTADDLDAFSSMFRKLRDAYHTISQADDSGPLMENIQDVYAGFTYGRTDVNESLVGYGAHRGFCV